MRYKATFSFSKNTMKPFKQLLINEFLGLRKEAVKELNHYFEIWGGTYARKLNQNVQSEIERYGYSVSEMKQILEQINKTHRSIFVELDCDEHGFIIGKSNDLIITMEIEEMK